jgi:hypothetical protein
LNYSNKVRRYCCGDLHKSCAKKWGACVICSKTLFEGIKKKYRYIPDPPDLTDAEILEQIEIQFEIDRQNAMDLRISEVFADEPPEVQNAISDYMTDFLDRIFRL